MKNNPSVDVALPTVQELDDSSQDSPFTSPFYCGWEWHMRKVRSVPTLLIYTLASRLTAKKPKKIFEAAAETAASFYGLDTSTVRRGIKPLCKLGFFEKLVTSRHGTNRYRVLSHDEWATKHPGKCAVYESQPETGQTETIVSTMPPEEPKATTELNASESQSNAKLNPDSRPEVGHNSAVPMLPPTSNKVKRSANVRQSSALSPAVRTSEHEELKRLTSELTYASDGQIKFNDRARSRLAEVVKEFRQEDIVAAFKEWLQDQDLTIPKNLQYADINFAEKAWDQVSYLSRRRQEKEVERVAREAAVKRLQEESKAERGEAERKKQEEENLFDPFSEVV